MKETRDYNLSIKLLPLILHLLHQTVKPDHTVLAWWTLQSLAHHTRICGSVQQQTQAVNKRLKEEKKNRERETSLESQLLHAQQEYAHQQLSRSWHSQYGHQFP